MMSLIDIPKGLLKRIQIICNTARHISFKIKEYIVAEHYKLYSSWLNAYALLSKKII